MKPLPIAPATLEDIDVWGHVAMRAMRRSHGLATELINPDSDRHDAELMHWAAVWRHNTHWEGVLFYGGELPFGGSHYLGYT